VIDKIYKVSAENSQIDFINHPDVREVLKKALVDENLLVKDI
jgi:hypothetical protein